MINTTPVRPTSSSVLVSFWIVASVWMTACEGDNIVNNVTSYERGSLTDPSIIPQVIFTSPMSNGAGPFEGLFNVGGGNFYPHFIIQFNKLISNGIFIVAFPVGTGDDPSSSSSIQGAVTIEGFDEPTEVRLSGSYGVEYSDIFGLRVYSESEYSPPLPYQVGRSYTVTVDTSLEDINGNHLTAPYKFSFTPEPFFRVVGVFPRDGATDLAVTPQSYIQLSFNSQITPSLLSSIQIQPQLQGTWQIEPDSLTAFLYPYSFFAFSTSYSITLNQDTKDKFGNPLAGGFHSTFNTAPFEVIALSPEDGELEVPPTTSISVEFTGCVDTATIRSALTIIPEITGTLFIHSTATGITVYPLNGLLTSTTYSVSFSPSLMACDGTILTTPTEWSFTTDRLRVTDSYPIDGEKDVDRWRSITLFWNSRLDSSTVSTAFSISPAVAGSINYNPNSTYVNFTPSTLLDRFQLYTVTISTALRSAHGEALQEPFTFSFLTGP